MEVLNRNQRSSALWRLSGLYAATIVIMGIIVFQAWKSYRSQADAKMARVEQMLLNMDKLKSEEKKQQDEAAKLQQQLRATQDSIQKLKSSSGTSSVTGNMQSGLNDVNTTANQAKATQTTVKNIGAIAKDLNPLKK